MVDKYVCIESKKKYDKKGAVTACNRRFHEDHQMLRIYPCHGHWHLTKQLRGKFNKTNKKNKLKYII